MGPLAQITHLPLGGRRPRLRPALRMWIHSAEECVSCCNMSGCWLGGVCPAGRCIVGSISIRRPGEIDGVCGDTCCSSPYCCCRC